MTKKTIAPIVLALVLGALPASADHRSEDRERNRRHQHEAYRSYHAKQDAKIRKQEAKIEKLAGRLDQATSELFSEAVTRTRHRSWREWRAIHALRSLERSADGFHARVERHGASGRRTEHAYRKLEHAYRVAVARCEDLRNARRLRDEFERVGNLMGKLDRRIAKLDELDERHRHASHRHDSDRRTANDDEDERYARDRSYSHRSLKPYVAFRFGF